MKNKSDEQESTEIPSGLYRAFILGEASARALLTRLGHASKALFVSDPVKRSELLEETEAEMAEILFSNLVRLRGTGLKLAQILCQDGGLLPAKFAEKFKNSFYQVPPLNRVMIRNVLKQELGDRFEQLEQIQWESAAAASLGQVHRAVLKDSKNPVAIKVQYPGVDRNVVTDMQLIRAVLSQLPNSNLAAKTMAILEEQLKNEVDYQKEAANSELFREKYSGPIRTPKVIKELSTKRVLVTEWDDGLPIPEWLLREPTEQEKQVVAQEIFDLYFQCVFQMRINHGDPHPGNFLVAGTKVALIDFGSMEGVLDLEVVALMALLFRSQNSETEGRLVAAYTRLGAQIENQEEFLDFVVRPFVSVANKIVGSSRIKITPDIIRDLRTALTLPVFHSSMRGFTPKFAYLHRSFLGTLSLVSMIGVEVETKIAQEAIYKDTHSY